MAALNRSRAEVQNQRAKLANSYNELLTEFSSSELSTVGNYTLGKLVGKGSFGKVYLATHKLTNGTKVVLKSAQKNDANLAREIHHHRQLIHPHIARLYEVIVTENLVWLVLEYCPGDELYNHLIQNGRLPLEKTRKIFAQLCGAVAYVHQKSCVHRDLKLENILLDKHENVKLVDFGFTREYERQKLLQTFCGTVCYSAPEMLKGEKYMAHAVDVWSLGVILYALLRGELPFDEDEEAETKRKILEEEPRYPGDLAEEAIPLLKSLLNKKPSLRPTLEQLLTHPFFAEWGPPQQDILAFKPAAPFTTKLERDTLLRMKSAGINIDTVIENVLAQRCDSLAGWWNLLIEKEQRKELRRQRRRVESRRISAASNLDPALLPPPIPEADQHAENLFMSSAILLLPGRQLATSPRPLTPPSPAPPPPIEKDYSPYLKPPQHPERQIMSSPDLTQGPGLQIQRRTRKQVIIAQLASLKHWFLDSAKRATSPGTKLPSTVQNSSSSHKGFVFRPETRSQGRDTKSKHSDKGQPSQNTLRPDPGFNLNTPHFRSTPPPKRNSLSPQPLTPHSSYRRSSGRAVGGRNSTSSSVSSIRSFHNKSHSKASSTSSASITSIKTPRSPRGSLRIHPSTPTHGAFPGSIRVVRGGYNEGAIFSGGTQYARRKRTPLKGPLLLAPSSAPSGPSDQNVFGGRLGLGGRKRESSSGRNTERGKSGGGIIEEEEEDEEIEEVTEFGPLGPGEKVVAIGQDEDDEEYDDGDSDTLRGRN